MRLREVALGCALGEAGPGVREQGGNNSGPDVLAYLANAGIRVPAAWCAAFVQAMTDRAAHLLSVRNPLDDVEREALVADYVALARARGWIVGPEAARRGDLVAFRFGNPPAAWNHIGIVMDRPVRARTGWSAFWSAEGNTGAAGGRDGDGVYLKIRSYDPERVCFIAWDQGLDPNPAAE